MEEVVVSNKALQLARQWVGSMTSGADPELDDNPDEPKLEMRPSRLGLGAKYLPHSQVTNAMNPAEKKLRAKLGISHKSAGSYRKTVAGSDVRADSMEREFNHEANEKKEDDHDDDVDSRTSTFKRKQMLSPIAVHAGSKKKKKKKKKS